MSSLTTTQIQSTIRKKILEETSELVSDTSILLNANLVYDDLKYRTFTNDQIKKVTIDISNGEGVLPSNFGTPYGPGYVSESDKTPFVQKSIMEFDRNPDDNSYIIDDGVLKVSPKSTSQIILRYFPKYEPLSPSQNPEINDYLHELIIYGACSRIYEDLQNEALSEYYNQKYEEKLEKKISSLSNYQEDNWGGNSIFNYQKLI